MKTYRSSGGPFCERPYFTTEDIERIGEDELRKADLYPKTPEPVRIERFIEKRFEIGGVNYEDLPEGVLGYTRFGPKGVEAVVVCRELGERQDKVARRRVNTTLAHEAGHGLVHAPIFALAAADDVAPLFNGEFDKTVPRILCRDVPGVHDGSAQRRSNGRWWEHQANQLMGTLLLPKSLVMTCIGPLLAARGSFSEKWLPGENRDQAAQRLAETFDVNPIVGRIRLQTLFPEGEEGQLAF